MGLGGTQRVVINLINWLQQNTQHEMLLIIGYERDDDKEIYDFSNIQYKYMESGIVGKIRSIRKAVKEFRPDVMLTLDTPQCLFDIPATFGLKVRNIVSERNAPSHFAGKITTKFAARILINFADGYVFQTNAARDFYGGRIAKNSVVIPNPLFNVEKLPTKPFEGNREKTIVTTGRLNKQKNHPMLIKAFKSIYEKYSDYKLIIYGEGPEREADQKLISDLGLNGKVLLPGATNDVPRAIYKAGIYVLSSDFEGMPNALIEAMALGLPCISTDCPCGGPRNLIKNGENGILVPVDDVKSLSNQLLKLIEDKEYAYRLGNNAFNLRKTLKQDIICQKWNDYFENKSNLSKIVYIMI